MDDPRPFLPDIAAIQNGLDAADSALAAVQQMIPAIRKRVELLREYADQFDTLCANLERLAERPPEQVQN